MYFQNRAREEVVEIMNRKNGKLEFSDLQEMPYLERCLKESLRIFPSVPALGRYLEEDVQFSEYTLASNKFRKLKK